MSGKFTLFTVLAAGLITSGCTSTRSTGFQGVYQPRNGSTEILVLDDRSMGAGTEIDQVIPMNVGGDATGAGYSSAGTSDPSLPPNAKPGECYARVMVPPTYKTITEQVLIEEASERIEMIPAEYEWGTEQVVVRPASEKLEIIPARYELRTEQVLVKPATTRVEEVPAEYDWVEEQVLVKPAQQVWKKGRGPVEKVQDGTGEIMCLIEVPAEYKTVRKRVLKRAASTRQIQVPAEYESIQKNVLVEPETTRRIPIPAEYKTVRVEKLVTPEKRKTVPIEPKYDTVTKQVIVDRGSLSWRRVLCETNMSQDLIAQIQQALTNHGLNPGPVDGRIGPQTHSAVEAFQAQNSLAVGGLTLETIKSLGIDLASTN